MPIYELRYYSGTQNWVIEGRGYWVTSAGEFSKINRGVNERREFDNIIELRYADGILIKNRELTSEENVIYGEMLEIVGAVKSVHPTIEV